MRHNSNYIEFTSTYENKKLQPNPQPTYDSLNLSRNMHAIF